MLFASVVIGQKKKAPNWKTALTIVIMISCHVVPVGQDCHELRQALVYEKLTKETVFHYRGYVKGISTNFVPYYPGNIAMGNLTHT